MLAHGVHLVLVAAGLAGLGALLAPTVAFRWRPEHPRDAHDMRVLALRSAVGQYAAGAPVSVLAAPPTRPVATETRSALALPLAVTSTVAAAVVHAAMTPPHLREGLLFGGFFLACALVQLAWAARAVRRPTHRWLVLGAGGNLAVVALWAQTRVSGLPFGLLPQPEAVGMWDAASVAWELVAAGACLAATRSAVRRTAAWAEWHPAAHAWLTLGATVLVVLALGGM